MDKDFKDHIYQSSKAVDEGRIYLTCPACSEDRSTQTHRRKEVLAVSYERDQAVYYCNHCGISGHVWKDQARTMEKPPSKRLDWGSFGELGSEDFDYLHSRGIDAAQLDLLSSIRYFSEVEDAPAIGFPYRLDENIKWIARDRGESGEKFVQWEVSGGGAGLYRRELVDYSDPCLVICEGEIDCESARHLGFNAVSVPNGAPTGAQAQKALKSINARLNSFSRIVIGMDGDEKGEPATEALVDLVGRKRAHTIAYPAGCKDLNDILVRFGPDALRSVLTNTTPSMSGITRAREFFPVIDTLRKDGFSQGASVGIDALDKLITWHPGLAVVTGIPGSGKSELVDQLAVSLCENAGWKWAIFSPENSVELHVSKLAAKRARAAIIGEEVLAEEDEYQSAREWVDDSFLFLPAESGTSVRSILDRADACVAQLKPEGCFGLIIDPWNYVSQTDVSSDETSRVNSLLAQLQVWAIENNALCVVIAHPTKASGIENSIGPYSISGSAHWFNRATYLIAVDADKDSFETDVHVMKVRFKWFGKTGVAPLTWDLSSGRYTSRMGDSTILEDIDWERVAAGDPDDEWGETKESETDYPVPPEVEENEGVVVEESDEDIPF
jgi:twinkle protein